ncbi:MAG: radical SAM protein [Patescibacteria group bacterium]|nr:radical SAM protein [Patescibacteria group bacterium]
MSKPTFSIQWHLTTKCEQRCKHCYLFNSSLAAEEAAGERLIDANTLFAIADDYVESCKRIGALPRVSLTGGNPLRHSHFWEVLDHFKKRGVKVHVLGNPFGITDDIAKTLVTKGVSKFQLSLDGLESTHDLMRQQESYKSTVNACRTLNQNGVNVAIMSTVSRMNMREMPMLAEKVVDMGARVFSFARFCLVDGDTSNLPTPNEYRSFLERMWGVFKRLEGRGTTFVLKDHLWNLYLYEIGEFQPKDTRGIIVDGCGVGISHLTILSDGSVYACRRFKSPVGKVPEQSLYDIFLSDRLNQYREVEKLEKCGKCNLFPYCRGCMAVSYSATGRWEAADPQCWR